MCLPRGAEVVTVDRIKKLTHQEVTFAIAIFIEYESTKRVNLVIDSQQTSRGKPTFRLKK